MKTIIRKDLDIIVDNFNKEVAKHEKTSSWGIYVHHLNGNVVKFNSIEEFKEKMLFKMTTGLTVYVSGYATKTIPIGDKGATSTNMYGFSKLVFKI